jgi:hypothetical protein
VSQIVLVWSDAWQTSTAASGFARRSSQLRPVGVVSVATNEQPKGESDFAIEHQSFTPEAGRANVWRIKLPQAMIEQARERVERFKSWTEEGEQQRPIEAPQAAAT